MSEINTHLWHPLQIKYDEMLAAYLEAKKDMEGTPTPLKLQNLILTTAALVEIRKQMKNEFPTA